MKDGHRILTLSLVVCVSLLVAFAAAGCSQNRPVANEAAKTGNNDEAGVHQRVDNLAAPAAHAAEGTASLESLLSLPLYPSLVAATDAGRVAWIENRRGVRNVFVTKADDPNPRQVTRFDADDGLQLAELGFSRDGNVLVFTRGGPPGFDGNIPNPTNIPDGTAVQIWVSRGGAQAAAYTTGSHPALSPDGSSVAFIRSGKIFVGRVSSSKTVAPVVEARGRAGALRWNPAGTRIAFVSDRDTHTFVGVYDLVSKRITWMAPGFGKDSSPAWAPDGSRLAFLRTPLTPVKPMYAWEYPGQLEILVADPATGRGQSVFRSQDSNAGWAQDTDLRPLQWAANDTLVFTSEADGWARYYAVKVTGGAPIALSPTGCEAREGTLSPDAKTLYFSGNCGDPDRSHIFEAPVTGGEARRLTGGSGIESAPVAVGSTVAFLGADARLPATPQLLASDRISRRTLAADAGMAAVVGGLVEPEPVNFQAADGMVIGAQLFRARSDTGKRPAVVFVHGGPERQMLLGWHPMEFYDGAYAFNQYLVSKGYVVLSVNYRTGTGRGYSFRRASSCGPRGASEYQDIVAAARWLGSRPDVDAARIAIWGGSYGGLLTALALARDPGLFVAGIDLFGVHDWPGQFRYQTPAAVYDPADERVALSSSPIADVSRWRAPVLFVHGDHDSDVPFSQTLDLVQRLQTLPRPPEFEVLALPDEVHAFSRYASWMIVLETASAFLDRNLRPEAAAIRLEATK